MSFSTSYCGVIQQMEHPVEPASSRLIQLDVIKGLAIIGVVAEHCGVCARFFYVFHVPLFFFVSGILAKPPAEGICELGRRVIKHICHYWRPFVIVLALALLLHNTLWRIGWYETPLEGGLSSYIRQLFRILTFGGGEQILGALWFLIVLCEIIIGVDFLLYWMRKLTSKQQTVLLFCMAIGFHIVGAYTSFSRSLRAVRK